MFTVKQSLKRLDSCGGFNTPTLCVGAVDFFIFCSIIIGMIAEYYLGLKFNFSHFNFLCADIVPKNVSLSLPPPNFSIK